MKIIEWSDADQCFVGNCPDLFYGGCYGDNEKEVFAELCEGYFARDLGRRGVREHCHRQGTGWYSALK
jgi:hypothetical protein